VSQFETHLCPEAAEAVVMVHMAEDPGDEEAQCRVHIVDLSYSLAVVGDSPGKVKEARSKRLLQHLFEGVFEGETADPENNSRE
jgi:hypothetical protein